MKVIASNLMAVRELQVESTRVPSFSSVDWFFFLSSFLLGHPAARMSRSRRTLSEPDPEHHMA
jgi:hypothetical protein